MPIYLDEPGLLERSLVSLTSAFPEDSFLFKNYFIELNEYYTGSASKNTNNIRVVQISDLHLRTIGYGLRKLMKRINEMKPDLMLFTGDMTWDGSRLHELDAFLKLPEPSICKAAILGNWEYDKTIDRDLLRKIYADNNCLLLVNETRQFVFKNKTVSITGIDDFHKGNADYSAAVKAYRPSDYHIVLTHCPEHRDIISQQLTEDVPVDFILSGHTHGGQFNFFGFVPFLPVGSGNYISGWYNTTEPPMFVSKGIGASVVPFRLGSRSEATVFHLKA